MGEVNREHVPEIGQPIYLKKVDPWGISITDGPYSGETRQSWLTHGCSHPMFPRDPIRYAKREYEPISRVEFEELRWVEYNKHAISSMITCVKDPSILRQIAALIGYVEGK